MSVPREAYQLAGVSLLALAAASTFQISGAAACSATANGDGDPFQTTSVTVECRTVGDFQDIDGVFTTRFNGFQNSSEIKINDYDGNGDDIVRIFGGELTDDVSTTPSVGGLPTQGSTSLQPADGTIELLGGKDQFEMFYGDYLGEPFAPNVRANLDTGAGDDTVVIQAGSIQDINLGDGTDRAAISGGATQVGDVTGGVGDDEITVGILETEEGVFYSAPTVGFIYGGDGSDTITIAGGNVAAVDAEAGDDKVSIGGDAAVELDVDGASGNDIITVGGNATIGGNIFGNGGNDTVNINGGTIGTTTTPGRVDLADGADIFNMTAGHITGSVFGEGGGNTYDVSGGRIDGSIFAGSQNDNVTVSGSASIGIDLGESGNDTDSVGLEDGDDSFSMTGGTLGGAVSGGAGNDTIDFRGGTINGFIEGNDGNDRIFVSGGILTDEIIGDLGNDTITISGGTIAGPVSGNDGDDHISISGGTIGTAAVPTQVDLGTGVNTFDMSGGTVNGSVFGEGGGNTYAISGGTVTGSLFAGDLNDSVMISGTANIQGNGLGVFAVVVPSGTVALEDGNDTFNMSGGMVGGSVTGDDGNDTVTVSGGTVGGNVSGGAGFDNVSVIGGTITGGIEAEHVHLSGGTIGGNITGLGPDTLVIDGIGTVDPLNLSDGVLFSGTNANGTVTDTDLAAGGKSQNFTGFDNFSADASTLRFSGGTQGINQLNLGNGSKLFINGNVTMPGSIIATTSSLIDMRNGVANDVLTLGGLTLNGARIGLDINQQTVQSDQLVAGAFSATGVNTIIVNLLGTPQFTQATDIPLIVSTNGPVTGTFSVAGVPGTPGSLFTYQVVAGPNGGLFLRATPANFGIAAAPTSATNAGAVTVAIDALYGINRDALDADLHLSPASGSGMVPVSESFGVFASGQFAHTEHDGYNISGGGLNGPGPSFDANDFSAAISLDFNAAKHFQFDNEYGLNIGVFAGYASTDVSLGAFRGFDAIGEGTNKAGLFGGYVLFRKSVDYALVSASGFIGGSDVTNGVLGTTGSYDTKGYAVTASVGHIFKLGERTRFDLRGGLLGVSFRGDPYTDSGGNEFGKSQLSFGAIKLEPGIYGDYTLSNGMVFSPYARGELQQRFGYKNTTEIDTREINFDDADFSAALSTGFNLKVSDSTTVNGEVRGKASSDSSTIGAKFGLKIAF
ncbi:autotransporter [Mesorhizobium sp. M0830]|uniref:autotransporter n=1 Tax=Mesorhizobium sp. M0830 TaxID=2957008 RepID=UPI003337C30A